MRKPNRPKYGHAIEHAIVRALIKELAKVGYKPSSVCADGTEIKVRSAKGSITEVFEWDDCWLYFRKGGASEPESGVYLVGGNRWDLLSNWHTGFKEFTDAVERVSDACDERKATITLHI